MFAAEPKYPKSEIPENHDWILHYPHKIPRNERGMWSTSFIGVISIDPGVKNYAVRYERWYPNAYVQSVFFTVTSFVYIQPDGSTNIYRQIKDFLSQLEPYFNEINYVIVEKQLPINYRSTVIQNYTIAYFNDKLADLPLLPDIISLSPRVKGRYLGAPSTLNKRGLKLWAVEKALHICQQRGDEFSLSILKKSRKKDDLADTIVQVVSFFLAISLFPRPIGI
jgi:hypothetical protein